MQRSTLSPVRPRPPTYHTSPQRLAALAARRGGSVSVCALPLVKRPTLTPIRLTP